MLISESGLKRAIKNAYKAGGYKIAKTEKRICIMAEDWYMDCMIDKMPTKILGTVVEHAGILPDTNEGLELSAYEKGPQSTFWEMTKGECESWQGARATDRAYTTDVTFLGYRLFQAPGDGEHHQPIYGIPEELMNMLEFVPRETVICDPGTSFTRAMFVSDEERVWIKVQDNRIRMDGNDQKSPDIWKALENCDIRPKRPGE